MGERDLQIDLYRELIRGQQNVRVRSLLIRQSFPEQGETWSQSLELLLQAEHQDPIAMSFQEVRDLRIDHLHPGVTCDLEIKNIASRQWENVNYEVYNEEQGLTLTFYCKEFRAVKVAR